MLALILAAAILAVFIRWGNGTQQAFLVEILWDGLIKKQWSIGVFFHPLVGLPLIGWISLVTYACLFPKTWLLRLGAILCLPLVLMVFLAGLLSTDLLQVASTLPFLLGSVLLLPKRKKASANTHPS